MNIEKALLQEHTKAQVILIQKYIGNDPKRFSELVEVFFKGPYRITQRASWPLSLCVEKNPKLVEPHLKALLNNLKKTDLHNAVKRNTVRLLQFISIPKRLQGAAASICFEYLQNPAEAIAVRVFSMTVLANIAKENPELKRELQLILDDQLPYASAGFKSRARKTIKQLSH